MEHSNTATIDQAMRDVFCSLLVKIQASSERILAGSDPEDVHDLRVACRRTRTILSQIPGVFKKQPTVVFKSSFRQIGTVTGKCRDLDVWLEAIHENRRFINPDEIKSFNGFASIILHDRDTARHQVREEIGRPWFKNLLDHWQTFLDTPSASPKPAAAIDVKEAVSPRILKAHNRLLKHGVALPERPSAAALHRLRIDGKKLRYLLEFFGDNFDTLHNQDLIKDLKSLQDALGGINDREVQLDALGLLESQPNELPPSFALPIGQHRQYLQRSLREFRASFAEEFRSFSEAGTIESFQSLFAQTNRGRNR